MDERRNIISHLDDWLEAIFRYHTIPSEYQRITEGKNQCLNFPKANDDMWERCKIQMEQIEAKIGMMDPYQNDDDLQVGLKSIKYYLNMERIRSNFVMFMQPCQENFKEARKKLAHLVGATEILSLEDAEIAQKQRELIEKRFTAVGEQIHEASYLLECSKIWSIKCPISGGADHWTDLENGEKPEPFHLNIFPREEEALRDMIIQATKLADHCLKAKVIAEDTNLLNDFDALISAIQNRGISKCQVFSPSTLLNPTEPDEEILRILSNPFSVIPSASVSVEEEIEKQALTEKEKEKEK